MTLIADKTILKFQEKDVNLTQPAWNKRMDAYNLALFPESGSGGARGVLEVTIIVDFDFRDGGSGGSVIPWTDKEKADFLATYKRECTATWAEKHRLVTTRAECDIKDVGVIFDVQAKDGGWSHSHWDVKCRKAASHGICWAQTHDGNNNVDLDSFDLTPAVATGAAKLGSTFMRRAAVHEFGHMLGFQDEYPDPGGSGKFLANPSHASDKDSIMYWGDTIYPRHYVLFADWLSLQWIKKDPAHCRGHDWKVNGITDMTNAQL